MNVPILGQAISTIPAQARLNAKETAKNLLTGWVELGLRHGRTETVMPVSAPCEPFLLVIDELVALGCQIRGITEVLANQGQTPCFMIHVLWELPLVGGKIH